MNNKNLLTELKEKNFTILDGKSLLQAPRIAARVSAENGDITCLEDINDKLNGCVLDTMLKEVAKHSFERFGGISSEHMADLYAVFDITVPDNIMNVSPNALMQLEDKLLSIAPHFDF